MILSARCAIRSAASYSACRDNDSACSHKPSASLRRSRSSNSASGRLLSGGPLVDGAETRSELVRVGGRDEYTPDACEFSLMFGRLICGARICTAGMRGCELGRLLT